MSLIVYIIHHYIVKYHYIFILYITTFLYYTSLHFYIIHHYIFILYITTF